MKAIIPAEFSVDGVPTDVTSVVLSDPTGAYGIQRRDTAVVIVAAGTAFTRISAGVYSFTTPPLDAIPYGTLLDIWVQYVSTTDGKERYRHWTYSVPLLPAGPGADKCTLTITTPEGIPVSDATVFITTDAAGKNTIAGPLTSNPLGQVVAKLTAGLSYYLWVTASGQTPVEGDQFTAVADT